MTLTEHTTGTSNAFYLLADKTHIYIIKTLPGNYGLYISKRSIVEPFTMEYYITASGDSSVLPAYISTGDVVQNEKYIYSGSKVVKKSDGSYKLHAFLPAIGGSYKMVVDSKGDVFIMIRESTTTTPLLTIKK
jgi:hypothetical protein